MAESIIEIETDGKRLNVATLMKQCDMKLKDIIVFHKLSVEGACFELQVKNMELYPADTVYGDTELSYFVAEDVDRFGRKVKTKPKIQPTKKTLLECLGLGWLLAKENKEHDIENVSAKLELKLSWRIQLSNGYKLVWIGYDLNHNLNKNSRENLLRALKATALSERGVILYNELLSAIVDPLLECLHRDWNKVLKL